MRQNRRSGGFWRDLEIDGQTRPGVECCAKLTPQAVETGDATGHGGLKWILQSVTAASLPPRPSQSHVSLLTGLARPAAAAKVGQINSVLEWRHTWIPPAGPLC